MKRLFIFDYFRGPDSTGLAAIRTNGDAKIAKIASHPIDLFDTGRFKDALNGNLSRAFIGHNRAATRGVVNNNNAHPYHIDHIVGAHNGTLDYDSTKRLEEALKEKYSVDSMALIAAIARFGVEEAIEMCSDDGSSGQGASAWSLVWFDQIKGTLNFLRNAKRPLWYAMTKDFKRLFWASEFPMIQNAVQMSNGGYELFTEAETFYRYRTTDENVWYEFDLAALVKGSETRPKPKAKEVKGRADKPKYTGNYSGGAGGSDPTNPFMRRKQEMKEKKDNVVGFARPNPGSSTSTDSRTRSTSNITSLTGSTDLATKKEIIHLDSSPEHPLANVIAPNQFANMAKDGCSWCHRPITDMLEPGLIIYERDDQVLCPEHSGTSQTRIYVKNSLYL